MVTAHGHLGKEEAMRRGVVNRPSATRAARVALLAAFTACDQPVTAPGASPTALAAKSGNDDGGPLPTRYVLPGDRVFPEGIAYEQGTVLVFVSSTTDGTVFRGDDSDETLQPFLPPGGNGRTTAIGLEVDGEGHLFVAGGGTGLV